MVEEEEEQLDPVGDLKEEEDVYDSDDVLCSSIAIDFLGWLEKCPLVARGDYSVHINYHSTSLNMSINDHTRFLYIDLAVHR